MNSKIIQLKQISKHFDDTCALNDISLDVFHGEFLTLLGPSGCGKTTLLRLIAGFESPDSGSIHIKGDNITHLPPEQRHVNTVFQNYALFPHMTVFDNVAFGLRCQKLPNGEVIERVNNTLAMVELQKLTHRKPSSLSGGQQQRVALARAIVNRPVVLLLDEPFSALDYGLRKNMRIGLKELQRELGITFIFVTHDQEEALALSDRIAIINEGKIEQIDTVRQLYEEPKNVFTANFIGEANIFDTQVINTDKKKISVLIEGKTFDLENNKQHQLNDKIHVVIRPEDIDAWGKSEITHHEKLFTGTIDQVIYKGSTVDLIIKLPSGKKISVTEFFDEDDPNLNYTIGETVWCEWKLGWEITLPYETN